MNAWRNSNWLQSLMPPKVAQAEPTRLQGPVVTSYSSGPGHSAAASSPLLETFFFRPPRHCPPLDFLPALVLFPRVLHPPAQALGSSSLLSIHLDSTRHLELRCLLLYHFPSRERHHFLPRSTHQKHRMHAPNPSLSLSLPPCHNPSPGQSPSHPPPPHLSCHLLPRLLHSLPPGLWQTVPCLLTQQPVILPICPVPEGWWLFQPH